MKGLSSLQKLLLYSLQLPGISPISFTRLSRLIFLAELNHKAIHCMPFIQCITKGRKSINWIAKGKEYYSPEIGEAIDKLLEYRLVKKTEAGALTMVGKIPVTLDIDVRYSLNTYMNSKYRSAHPKKIDEEQTRLLYPPSLDIIERDLL